jgi:hypothetical protein
MLNWAARYQPHRSRYWPEVETFFTRLPPPLFQQAVLLKNNLATFYADTGQFKHILARPHDPPFLYLHFWLLDDWSFPDDPHRANLEKHLFLAALFGFAGVYTHETILDEGSNFDHTYLFLAQALHRQAQRHLASIHSPAAPFWDYCERFWQEYVASLLAETITNPIEPAQVEANGGPIAGKLAFAKIPAVAVAIEAGQPDDAISLLGRMLDQLHFILQTLRDITTIRRDLMRRRYTYPLLRTMQEAGLDPAQPVIPERVLGALVLTGTVEKIGQEAHAVLELCRAAAAELRLPSFTNYFTAVEEMLTEVMALFSLKPGPKPAGRPQTRPFFAPSIETLPKVIEMAEGYLLADPTFRESWEVQRRGLFGRSEMTAKAFPAGLITEILCRHGHNMARSIDLVFSALQAAGFRYYDHDHLPPDADDLGLLLRLYPYSTQPEQHRHLLQTPLRWLEQNLGASGEIPVWFSKTDDLPATSQPFTALWGNSCAAVEANLLLGLIDYDWSGYRRVIEASARQLCGRWLTQGLNAAWHYTPLYTLWTILTLTTKLSAKPIQPALQQQLVAVRQALADRLIPETQSYRLNPQDAAFLTLICLSEPAPETTQSLFQPDWITLLCKRQRYDGSWPGEPLFGTPTRGELAAWYASNPVTTAFCYHALKSYQAHPHIGNQ